MERIAAHLDAPVGTVKSLLSRARKRLRGLVEQADEEARMAMDVFSERRDALALYHLHTGDGARSV